MAVRRDFHKGTNASTLAGDAGPSAPGTGAVRWSISPEQAKLLAELARGRSVLEIGTGTGLSAEWMARTARSVTTYDVDSEVERLVWPHLPRNVTARNRTVSPLSGGPYEMVFVDGLHDHAAVLADIQEARPLTDLTTIWVFHDYHMQGVSGAIAASKLFRVREVQSDAGPTTMAICERER
jgi:predicted O-methyltransferase YrrM